MQKSTSFTEKAAKKRNNTSVPYPPVAPICLVCQVKDVLFYFSVKGFCSWVSASDTEKSQGWWYSLRLKNAKSMFSITFFSAPSSLFFKNIHFYELIAGFFFSVSHYWLLTWCCPLGMSPEHIIASTADCVHCKLQSNFGGIAA